MFRKFQSTLPHGSDSQGPQTLHAFSISIHAPSRERQSLLAAYVRNGIFQSTLPHGSDDAYLSARAAMGISIHAPSRERHIIALDSGYVLDISIHAPSRERPQFATLLRKAVVFQSTLPHGSDYVVLFVAW